MSLKEKIRVVLNQKGTFNCPNGNGSIAVATPKVPAPPKAPCPPKAPATPAKPKVDNYAVVLADLKKRGTSRPRKLETLKNTIRSIVKNAKGTLTPSQLDTMIKHLQENAKITIEDTKVSYSL